MFQSTLALAAIAGFAAAQQGYGYGASSTTSASTTIPTGVPDAETCNCYLKLSDCQTAPDANQSFCASQFASCVGYSPYDGTDATTKYFDNLEKYCTPASSTSAPPHYSTSASTSAPPQYTTSATSTGSSPPSAETCACYAALGQCQTAEDANQSFCASQFAGCIKYNPYSGTSAEVTAFFDNLEKNCPSGGSTSSSSAPAYHTSSSAPAYTSSMSAPPSYTTMSSVHAPPTYSTPSTGNGTVPSGTQSPPAVYTGAASVMAVGPVVAVMAFGSLFL